MKKENLEKVKECFQANAHVEEFFVTEDGQCFISEHNALNHAKEIGSPSDKLFEIVKREDAMETAKQKAERLKAEEKAQKEAEEQAKKEAEEAAKNNK